MGMAEPREAERELEGPVGIVDEVILRLDRIVNNASDRDKDYLFAAEILDLRMKFQQALRSRDRRRQNQKKPSRFAELVAEELSNARHLHPKKQNSAHEGWAVLAEEFVELAAEVFKKRSERSPDLMRAELVQIGAMAQRMAEDLSLV